MYTDHWSQGKVLLMPDPQYQLSTDEEALTLAGIQMEAAEGDTADTASSALNAVASLFGFDGATSVTASSATFKAGQDALLTPDDLTSPVDDPQMESKDRSLTDEAIATGMSPELVELLFSVHRSLARGGEVMRLR
jgi:hypothetical protein